MFALSCVLRAGLNGTLSVVQTSGINTSVIIGGLWVVALAACAAMWKILKPKGHFHIKQVKYNNIHQYFLILGCQNRINDYKRQ